MTPNPATLLMVFCAALLIAQGCAGPMRKDAVPPELTTRAVVPGLNGVRYRVGIDTDALRKDAIDSFWKEAAFLKASGHKGKLPPAVFLAVSGGGDDGAFGAGLLNGWTAAGDRPEFKLVTGVSTGAPIAPFAFLGPARDESLKRFYAEVSPSDIEKKRSIIAALTSDALADNAPLRKLVEREVDQGFLDAVAAEHEKGRMLLIVTTDLDARLTTARTFWRLGA